MIGRIRTADFPKLIISIALLPFLVAALLPLLRYEGRHGSSGWIRYTTMAALVTVDFVAGALLWGVIRKK